MLKAPALKSLCLYILVFQYMLDRGAFNMFEKDERKSSKIRKKVESGIYFRLLVKSSTTYLTTSPLLKTTTFLKLDISLKEKESKVLLRTILTSI